MEENDETKKVIEFILEVVRPWRYRSSTGRVVTAETKLEKDLWITGDDAGEFMEAFFIRFGVVPKGFRFEPYFHGEGITIPLLTPLLYRLLNRKPKPPPPSYDLTVEDLANSVRAGKWIDPS